MYEQNEKTETKRSDQCKTNNKLSSLIKGSSQQISVQFHRINMRF